MRNSIIKIYEEIFGKVNGNLAYELRLSPTNNKQIDNFIDFLNKNLGMKSYDEDFIFLFISYQFYRKKDQKTRFGVGRVPLNHVIGKKAFFYWERKPDNWKYWVDRFIAEYKINRPKKVAEPKKIKIDLIRSEEKIKEAFYNTEKALFICSEYTTLFNPISKFCISCKFKEECKALQKDIYPDIYEKRKS